MTPQQDHDQPSVDLAGHRGVSDTFVRPCHGCGITIRVEAGVEQPHEHHAPTEDDGSPLVFAWWQGYDAAQVTTTELPESNVPVVDRAREARYAEAIKSVAVTDSREQLRDLVEAVMAVADAEQATLIAERDEARDEFQRLGRLLDFQCSCCWDGHDGDCRCPQCDPAAAEAEVRDLRAKVAQLEDRGISRAAKRIGDGFLARAEAAEAKVRRGEALADEWDRSASLASVGGYGFALCASDLRTALASVGRTEPSPDLIAAQALSDWQAHGESLCMHAQTRRACGMCGSAHYSAKPVGRTEPEGLTFEQLLADPTEQFDKDGEVAKLILQGGTALSQMSAEAYMAGECGYPIEEPVQTTTASAVPPKPSTWIADLCGLPRGHGGDHVKRSDVEAGRTEPAPEAGGAS